ncbi:glycoside hydrolase family 31 protein [Pengzhenrongella sicca]|uniref:Glycoside hydrolase n=1 Tax=Pengzhenrongella sicca TaxID=2819238 RepID=A0A8A4Z980_9MICO|nr:glycoside hydrolase family 31 protein [Pengzhenrongella sicca]QTE28432.1 hypothetical protein J4E96_13730 [Pengzhenrongella sicca]
MFEKLPVGRLVLPLLPDERWWGGAVSDGDRMPFGGADHARDLATSAGHQDVPGDLTRGCNQSAPVLVSSRGRFVWSDRPFSFAFADGSLSVIGAGIVRGEAGTTLAEAFGAVSRSYFPASGLIPAEAMFSGPQYNTWIEMPYLPTQVGVLRYVRDLLEAGFPPGVVMIDDRWSRDYGTWQFDPERFPDPAEMIRQLHGWGCAVMLWLVPFVSPDSAVFRYLRGRDLLVRGPDGDPAVRAWWNGYSAVLDTTNVDAVAWLHGELDALVEEFGVDGFKFDGGDVYDYRADDLTAVPSDPVGQCESWARVGVTYRFNEYRACWKMGGQPLAQRLHDKPPIWGSGGLSSLIPEAIAQGLIGHAFTCPDMIGGGDLAAFGEESPIDQELFVRFAQCAALFPMMQFSLAPWRVLDPRHLAAVLAAVRIRQQLVPRIVALARHAAATGEPVLRPIEYHFPGYEQVTDQFLLGADILVAPVLERDARTRRVVVPPGRWARSGGEVIDGPCTVDLRVELASVPWFRRVG